jgi:23S rRNA A2030 N6-methylase RlmJ
MINRDGKDKIDRDDLFLLMESYKNTIELNTTLLERQEILSQLQAKLIESISEVCGNQSKILQEIKSIPEALSSAANHLADELKRMNDAHSKEIQTLRDQLAQQRNAEVKEHAGFNNRLYVALSGMVGIVLALIGLLIKIV